jgi:hypothetical protein
VHGVPVLSRDRSRRTYLSSADQPHFIS